MKTLRFTFIDWLCFFLRWMSDGKSRGTLDNKQCAGAIGGHCGVQQRQSEATTQI